MNPIPPSEIFLFLKLISWEFHAVQAADSDEALLRCLEEKDWDPAGIVYLGWMEGCLPKRPRRSSLLPPP
jgi:hypothetical protein